MEAHTRKSKMRRAVGVDWTAIRDQTKRRLIVQTLLILLGSEGLVTEGTRL